jgi:hypothetical protein
MAIKKIVFGKPLTKQECDDLRPLAGKMAAAFISYHLGIGLDYAHKRYIAPQIDTLGAGWALVAEIARAVAVDGLQSALDGIDITEGKD